VFKLINKGQTLHKNNLETILSNAISGAVHLTIQILQSIWLTNQKKKFYKLTN